MGFISLYTAFSGLQAAQAGMDTASHNVSNAGTVGYTRQSVELASRLPGHRSYGPVGTGVDVTDITRSRDVLLDARVRAALGDESKFATLGNLLSGVEAAMAEPENGVTSALDGLWSAFEDLALDPPDSAARHGVINHLQTLAARVRSVAEAWQSTAATAGNDLGGAVEEANRLLRDVADLNHAILESGSSGFTPNDLLDKRDIAVDRLSQLAGVRVSITDTGTARVSLDGLALVHDRVASQLSFDPGTNQIMHSSGVAVDAGGELGARQTFVSTVLPGFQADLDTFAEELAGALNTQHAAGFTQAGAAGGDLLTYSPGSAALTLNVAIFDPADLAVAGGAPPVAAFDGLNAEALGNLQFTLSASGGTETLGSSMRGIVGDVGGATAAAFTEARSQSAIAGAAESARAQMHGVSVDEEMVNLITYQRAYEAAARVMTTVDQALDTLINRTGVVGR